MRKRLGGLLGLILAALCCLYALYALSLRQASPWQQAEVVSDGSVDCDDVQPFDAIWDGFQAGWGDNRAAAFTPFHITPGGGEKYLLSAVQALQDAGYFVTVYVYDGNECRTKEQLLATAAALRVNLNPDMVTLSMWHPDPPRVRVFFALGNDKYPQQRNIGLVGFFMCQFPFDLDLPPKNQEELAALASYDHVLVNSRFTFRWFNAYITQTIDHYYQQATLMPSVDVLHPPCTILQYSADTPRQNIVMLGRFFDGRQSKGHPHAIQLFSQMAPHLPAGTRLVLIGQLVVNHDSYLQTLRDQVASLPAIADRVDFVVSASPEQVEAQLQAASLQWHMTGLEVDPSVDPASREHFGISIVECMSAGVIPIALHGGPEDIIDHAVNGFLAVNAEDIMRYTLHVHKAHGDMMQRMRAAAVDKASAFSYASFQKQFLFYMHRALLTRPHRHFIRATAQRVRACADISVARESPMAAMIIEPRNHYALEYTIYNVMAILSKSPYPWTLHVYHTPVNQQLVQRIIAAHPGLRHTQLHELPPHMLDVSNYNQMMKTERLWSSLGNATKVLLFQTDSLIINPGIERFIKYDYVGAPWHQQNERWNAIVAQVPSAVGNGGFSLRTVSVMKEIAKQHGHTSGPTEQEDIFYAARVFKNHVLSPRSIAYDFCLEVPCDDLLPGPEGPFAVHAAWYYNPVPVVQELLYQSLTTALCSNCSRTHTTR